MPKSPRTWKRRRSKSYSSRTTIPMVFLVARWWESRRSPLPSRPLPTQSSTPRARDSKCYPLLRTRSCKLSRFDRGGTVMKSFENIDAKTVAQALTLLQKFQQEKKSALVVTPDYVINLKTIPGLNTIKEDRGGLRIGALTTLVEVEEHPAVREKLLILSDAVAEAASPQIRNAGTIGGNICQRPFCWYFRSANFNCLRKGGQVCYS